MNCRKARQWISLERDGQLQPQHVVALQTHLESCTGCQEYRSELTLGLRMLAATEPRLPETFDWKLQLRLSQALREAARETAYPWPEESAGWRPWLGRAGLSAALGLAAVLAVAVIAPDRMAPVLGGQTERVTAAADSPRLPLQASLGTDLQDATRRPLDGRLDGGLSRLAGARATDLQRRVSSNGLQPRSWSGARDQDLLRILRLEQDVEVLRRRLATKDRTIQTLQARLDSLTARTVDRNTEAVGTR